MANTLARRSVIQAWAGLVMLASWGQVFSQTWPAKPVTLIVGFPAGGPTDVVARTVANELSRRSGQPVIVENKPGASGSLALNSLQSAPKDGQTLMMLVGLTLNFYHFNGKKVDYQKDVEPVAEIYDQYNILVINPAVAGLSDVQTLNQLLAKAKASPDGLNYASAAVGSLGHLTTERIAGAAGVRMQHITYRGAAPAMNDLLGGQVGIMYADSQSALPHIRSGKLRAIAVSSIDRQPELPAVPSMSEQGFPGLTGVPWGGIVAPPKTPKALVEAISAEIKAVLETPEIREKFRLAGVQPAYKNPSDFGAFANKESAIWGKVIVDRGIKPE